MHPRPESNWVNLGGASCRCCGQRFATQEAKAQEEMFVRIVRSLQEEPKPTLHDMIPKFSSPTKRYPRRLGPYKLPR